MEGASVEFTNVACIYPRCMDVLESGWERIDLLIWTGGSAASRDKTSSVWQSRELSGDVFGLFCFYFNALRAEKKLHLYHERTMYEAEEEHPGPGNVFSTKRSTSTWCVHGNNGGDSSDRGLIIQAVYQNWANGKDNRT